MKKSIVAMMLSGAMTLVIPFYSLAQTQTTVAHSSVDYAQLVTKRQVVDQLLVDAVTAFKSPSRISHAGFTAKMPTNMQIVTDRLLEAYQLEPYRTDLLISAANAQIYNSDIDRALDLYQQALAVAPDDIDLHSYLAVWLRVKGDETRSKQHMNALAKLNPGRLSDLQKIFAVVDRILTTPLKETAHQPKAGKKCDCHFGLCTKP